MVSQVNLPGLARGFSLSLSTLGSWDVALVFSSYTLALHVFYSQQLVTFKGESFWGYTLYTWLNPQVSVYPSGSHAAM